MTFSPEAKAALSGLADDPEEFLTDDDRTKFAEWSEANRLRRTQIAMETGVDRVG